MICVHFFRSLAKLELVVSSRRARPCGDIITSAAQGDALHPFCGAVSNTSTPVFSRFTKTVPLATQSRTNKPPCSCTASATALIKLSGTIRPAEVSTCGQQTTSGFSDRIAAIISSSGTGANGASLVSSSWRAARTVVDVASRPASIICDQRKLNQPLRITRTFASVVNWRAIASIP